MKCTCSSDAQRKLACPHADVCDHPRNRIKEKTLLENAKQWYSDCEFNRWYGRYIKKNEK